MGWDISWSSVRVVISSWEYTFEMSLLFVSFLMAGNVAMFPLNIQKASTGFKAHTSSNICWLLHSYHISLLLSPFTHGQVRLKEKRWMRWQHRYVKVVWMIPMSIRMFCAINPCYAQFWLGFERWTSISEQRSKGKVVGLPAHKWAAVGHKREMERVQCDWIIYYSSVAQSRPTLATPMDCSTSGFAVHCQL